MKRLFILLSALVASTAGAGGIAVTNGYRMFAASGITVQYRAELTLQEISPTAFNISNAELAKREDKVSKVSFTVAKVPGKTLAEVKADMEKRFPKKTIAEMEQPGAKGFYWEERSDAALTGHYDLLTSNGDLVDIKLEAFAAADGIQWVAPIVHSLVYDNSGPVIHELKLENRKWEAGTTQKLHLRITDDYSGIDPEFSLIFEAPLKGTQERKKSYYFADAKLIPEGGDWYTAEVAVNRYTPSLNFRISAFNLIDRAKNRRRYEADLQDAHYTADPAAPGPAVKTLRMPVINHGPEDATPPRIVGFRPDSSTWETGSTHRVYFKLVDDISGVSLEGDHPGISQPCSQFRIDEKRFCVGVPGVFPKYRSEGNDWYSAEFKVQNYLPSGEYRINRIVVLDGAGNNVMLDMEDDAATEPGLVSSFKIQIHNPGVVDVTGPTIHEWRLDASSWKVGGKGRIYVRLSDEGTGIEREAMFTSFNRLDGAATPFISTKSGKKGNTKDEGGGWYSMELEIDQFVQAGTYYPSFLAIKDKAGNETFADCEPDGSCQIRDGEALKLPPQQVEFVK